MEARLMTSCEDPNTVYVCLADIRLVFNENEYIGWYAPGPSGNEEEDCSQMKEACDA